MSTKWVHLATTLHSRSNRLICLEHNLLVCRATLVGNRVIVMGGLGSRLWSCKEVSPNLHTATLLSIERKGA